MRASPVHVRCGLALQSHKVVVAAAQAECARGPLADAHASTLVGFASVSTSSGDP